MTLQRLLHETIVWLMLAVPEGMLMVLAGTGLLGVRRPARIVAPVGFAVGTASSVFRLSFPGGFHVPLVLVLYVILVTVFLGVSLKTAVLACFVSSVLVNLGQIVVALPVLKLTGLPLEATFTSLPLHLAFGWLGESVLLLGACWVMLRHGVLFRVPESHVAGGSATSEHQKSSSVRTTG